MKKTMLLTAAAAMLSLTACGPSKEELARREQARQDSIHYADSVAAAQKAAMERTQFVQDSIAQAQAQAEIAAMEKARQDSIADAEKNKKGSKKKK